MNHVQRASAYADKVLSGETPAGEHVKLACKRFKNDLAIQNAPEFAFVFDEKRAERPCNFIEKLPHVKGKWARTSKPLKLEDWQCFLIVNIFGWVKKADGARRFIEAYLQIPRKNGKSFLAAGIGLYMFAADDEPGAEVYSGATSEKQAWEVFRPAREIANKTSGLCRHFGVTVNAKSLYRHGDGSKFEPVVGKPGDGASPHCWILDEFHEHDTPEQYDTAATGMGAREQPLILIITTAGTHLAGPCYEKYNYARDILSGARDDSRFFSVIYGADPSDAWDSIETARKANPNFGVSVLPDYLEARLKTAKQSAIAQNSYKTKHLNIWVGARAAWMPASIWTACPKPKPLSELKGRQCYVGFDLATNTDLAVRVAVFPPTIPGEPHHVHIKVYLPQGTIDAAVSPNTAQYHAWALQGHLTITDGDITDQEQILNEFKEFSAQHPVIEAGYDPYQAEFFAALLITAGYNLVKVPQTVAHLSEPMKRIDALARSKLLAHDHPILTWCMTNVTARMDDKDNIFPRRATPEAKIDAAVGLIIAFSRMVFGQQMFTPRIFTL